MGSTHAATGAALYLAAVPALAAFTATTPTAVAVGVVAAAGGALLPDLDHPRSAATCTLAPEAFGPVTRLLSHGIAAAAEGHRQGTHSVLGTAVAVAATVGTVAAGGWPLVLFLTLLLGLGLTGMGVTFARHPLLWTLGVVAGVGLLVSATVTGRVPATLVPYAVGVGYVAHLAGDMLTPQRCPLLWLPSWLPLPLWLRRVTRIRFGVGLVRTSGWVEDWVVAPAVAAVGVWLLLDRSGWLTTVTDAVRR